MKDDGSAVFVKTEQQPRVGRRSSKRNFYSLGGPIIRSGPGHLLTTTKTQTRYRSCYKVAIGIHPDGEVPKISPPFNELIPRLLIAIKKSKKNSHRESNPGQIDTVAAAGK